MIRMVTTVALLLSASAWTGAAGNTSATFRFGEDDNKLLAESDALDRQYKEQGLLYRDPQAEAVLNRVGARLTSGAAPPEHVTYQFRILRDPMINAFALGNGSVYVNTGLIALLENEAQLAAVLAHEITHVVNRDEYELNRDKRTKALILNVLTLASSGVGYLPMGAAFGRSIWAATVASKAAAVSTLYGYSRSLELEADNQGFTRMTAAQYDGAAMVRALELLDEKIEFEPVEPFWRTHPRLEERIAIAKRLAQHSPVQPPRTVSDQDYLTQMQGVIRYSIREDLENRRIRTATARALRLVAYAPRNAFNETLLADSYRDLGAKTALPRAVELTKDGRAEQRTRMLKNTIAEEQNYLLARPEGVVTLQENRAKSESIYRQVIADDSAFPDAHRGLGGLYERENKNVQAAAEYREYLRLAPADAIDRLLITHRLEKAESDASAPAK